MAPKDRNSGSPWSSSTFLPFGISSRRNSVSSLSSRAGLDRDTISSALDTIHSSASRVPTLVTFNDFASPPPPPKGSEEASSPSTFSRWFRSSGTAERPTLPPLRKHRKMGSEAEKTSAPPTPSVYSLNTQERDFASPTLSPRRPPTSYSEHVDSSKSQLEGPPDSPATYSIDSSSKLAKVSSKKTSHVTDDQVEAIENHRFASRDGSAMEKDSLDDGNRTSFSPSAANDALREFGPPSDAMQSQSQDLAPPKAMAKGVEASEHTQNVHASITQPSSAPDMPFKKPAIPRLPTEKFQPRGSPRAALTKINVAASNTSDAEIDPSPVYSSSHTPSVSRSPSRPPQSSEANSLIHEMRRKILSRDFWMKDENAKVCFSCGDTFTAFRRKHHCRTCGQIYDSKCTVLYPGTRFGQPGKLKICKTCENMIEADESSDCSDEDEKHAASHGKSIRFSGVPPMLSHSQSRTSLADGVAPNERTHGPLESRRRSTLNPLENLSPALTRPSSSRSLKSLSGRPMSSSHRQRRSLHQHMRSFPSNYTNATIDESKSQGNSGNIGEAGHPDEIIDPDLAPFMSDEGSSDEEPLSIAAAMGGNPQESHNPAGVGSAHGLVRKSRPRPVSSRSIFDPSLRPRDPETASIRSSRPGTRRRTTARTMSMGSTMAWPPMSPRIVRSGNLFTDDQGFFGSTTSLVTDEGHVPHTEAQQSGQNQQGPSFAELNMTSLQHVRTLLKQLLSDANIQESRRWEKALVPLLLRCAEEIDPNIQRGDDIDIRHYIKLKKVPQGRPRDTAYVSGVVFSKNMAKKGMRRSIPYARLLLVSFPIVYARHQQHFMSLDAVIAQEKEYLRNLVRRIIALKPDVVLVQKQVSGLALDLLRDTDITVAYNVKESVLHAVSRCTHSRIITSVDKLSMDAKHLGSCEQFDIKTFSFGNYKKTYFFVSGCQRDLGCTIVLRGGDLQTLTKMKWITEFMCYVVYNLKLETSLIRDQFSLASSTSADSDTANNSPISLQKAGNGNGEAEATAGVTNGVAEATLQTVTEMSTDKSSESMSDFRKTFEELDRRVLSISPSVKLAKPELVTQGLNFETDLYKIRTEHQKLVESLAQKTTPTNNKRFELVGADVLKSKAEEISPSETKALLAIRSAERLKVDQQYAVLRRRWETFISGARDPLSPLSHQQIVVLLSVVSYPSMNACEGPDLLSLGFYQEHNVDDDWEPDMPLGEYVERLCEQANSPCLASRCDKKMINHHRRYVHGEGQIEVVTQSLPAKVRGMENTILMWSVCQECSQETPVVPMSRNTWKYSFAKYLELSFWSRKIEPRAGICPHDISKSHKRFFGFRNLAVSVTYDVVKVMEVSMPKDHVSWLVEKDLPMKNGEFTRIKERLERFMASVTTRIDSIKLESVRAEDLEKCKLELESYRGRVKDERELLMSRLQVKYQESKYYEVIPLNRAVRAIQEKVGEWVRTFAEFEKRYFPSEKDIRKLAAQQLKNVYLARTEMAEKERFDEKHGNLVADAPTDIHTLPDPLSEKSGLRLHDQEEQGLPIPERTGDQGLRYGSVQLDASAKSPPHRVFDELDLAESPSTPITRDRVANADLTVVQAFRPGYQMSGNLSFQDPKSDEKVSTTSPDAEVEVIDHEKAKSLRRRGGRVSPVLVRSRTQPTSVDRSASPSPQVAEPAKVNPAKQGNQSFIPIAKGLGPPVQPSTGEVKQAAPTTSTASHRVHGPSMIPKPKHRINSKVTALARHFEQMSREFERERLRERRQRAARVQQARVYSTASVQPIVEVFEDAQDAVRANEHGKYGDPETGNDMSSHTPLTSGALAHAVGADEAATYIQHKLEGAHYGGDSPEDIRSERSTLNAANNFSDNEVMPSDIEPSALTDTEEPVGVHEGGTEPFEETQTELVDISKHDKVSIMRMLSSFWSERSASGWAALEYPLAGTDHIFGDQDVILREDELSSLIAFSLESADYRSKCKNFRERAKLQPTSPREPQPVDTDMENTLLGETATHLTYRWAAGPAKMECRILFAEGFDAMRLRCGVSERFVESLSRCVKWDSRGGKSKSIFLKTMDERFIVKSLPEVEAQAFVRFAPDYFDYMTKCLFHSLPSAIAKILGLYHINIKNPVTGVEFTGYLQVMENVFYEGPSNRMFDLKGSMRNRRAQSTGERNEVLLDENLLDYLFQTPIYIKNHSNSFLTSSISNDTLFCAKQNVMDYSLIVGLHDDKRELVVGIIDYIRTYTWDKKLESWIKDRGKNKPTVRSPRDYRNRFRTSIANYFPLAPSCWQIFGRHRVEPSRAFWDSIGVTQTAGVEGNVSATVDDAAAEAE
ncbi:MAG: hypothetical protein Q9162_006645 [Coniocarpon cinnabarinum]